MALPCLGKLRLGALKEAPTGVLSEAAARNYDPDGREGQMLRRIAQYEYARVGEADRTVEYYENEVLMMQGMEGEDSELLRLQAASDLAVSRLAAARAHRDYDAEIADMRNVVKTAREHGLFSIPWDRLYEVELPAQQALMLRALGQLNEQLDNDVSPFSPLGYSPTTPEHESSYSPTAPPRPSYSPGVYPPPSDPMDADDADDDMFDPDEGPTPQNPLPPADAVRRMHNPQMDDNLLPVPFMSRAIRDAIRDGYQYDISEADAVEGALETRPEPYIENVYENVRAWRAGRPRAAPLDPRARDLPSVEQVEQNYLTQREAMAFMVRAILDAVLQDGYRYANVVEDVQQGGIAERSMTYVANIYLDVRLWRLRGQPMTYSTASPTRLSPSPIPEQSPRRSPPTVSPWSNPTGPSHVVGYSPTAPSYTAGGSPRAATDDVPTHHDPDEEDIVVRAQRLANARREAAAGS